MHRLLQKKTAMDAMNEALLKPTEYPAADKDYDHPMWFKGTEPEQIKHASTYTCSDCGHKQANNVSCVECGNACSFSKPAEIKQHEEPRVLPPRDELRSHLDDEVKNEIKKEKEGKLGATQPLPPPTRGFQPWYTVDREPHTEYTHIKRPATESDEFLKWFGDSKVRNEEGEPLTVFHATSHEGKMFSNRGKGYGQFGHWFDVQPYSVEGYAHGQRPEHRPNMIPVFLSIQRPKVYPDTETFKDAVNGKFGPNVPARAQKLRTELKKEGYDGALINNASSGGLDYWVAFDTKQIKSAIGNSGEFSTTDKSIMARLAAKSIQLTPEQDQFWQQSFEFYAQMGHSEVKAVRMADRETVSKWPELAKFRHWTDPNTPPTAPTA